MFRRIREWWRRSRRQEDLEFIWPALLNLCSSRRWAEYAFMVHAREDPAWEGFSREDILDLLDSTVCSGND